MDSLREQFSINIPEIPAHPMKFGDPAWIEVSDSHRKIHDFLDCAWGIKKRFALYKNGKKTAPVACEVCLELVCNGDNYTRGYGCWCHLECYEKARAFYAKVNEIAPSVYRRPIVKF